MRSSFPFSTILPTHALSSPPLKKRQSGSFLTVLRIPPPAMDHYHLGRICVEAKICETKQQYTLTMKGYTSTPGIRMDRPARLSSYWRVKMGHLAYHNTFGFTGIIALPLPPSMQGVSQLATTFVDIIAVSVKIRYSGLVHIPPR